jgi:EmrB/QacA subfamily drug resistance transporter
MTAPQEYPPGEDPRRWRALIATLAGGFLILLDVSIVTVAIPSIQSSFQTSPSAVQWVVSGYPLTFGLVLVAGGRLGDQFGRRTMYLVALCLFVATSVLAGAAQSMLMLVIARLLQGFAGGLVTPQNGGLIQDLFRGPERGRAFGLLGAMIGISTAVGPIVGGLLIDAVGEPDGWRWVFLINLPVGLLTIVLALLYVPKTPPRTASTDIDLVGIVLLGVAVFCVLLPIVQSDSGGIERLWWLFLVAIPFAVAFLRWEHARVRRERSPLLDPRLFTATPGYPSGALIASVYFCGFSGIFLVAAVFTQGSLGLSPLESGLVVTPFALGSAVSSFVAGRLVDRYGRWVTIAGLATIAVGLGLVALLAAVVDENAVAWAILAPLALAGIGGGAVISPNTTLTLACVPNRMAGVASGVLQTGQRIGTAVGTALLAAVFHAFAAPGRGFAVSMLAAALLVLVALGLAVVELRSRRSENFPANTMASGQ